jgi:hypothetical protein
VLPLAALALRMLTWPTRHLLRTMWPLLMLTSLTCIIENALSSTTGLCSRISSLCSKEKRYPTLSKLPSPLALCVDKPLNGLNYSCCNTTKATRLRKLTNRWGTSTSLRLGLDLSLESLTNQQLHDATSSVSIKLCQPLTTLRSFSSLLLTLTRTILRW